MKKRKLLMLFIFACAVLLLPSQAAAKVQLNKKNVTVYVGKTTQLKLTGISKKMKWSTSNKKIATVSQKGVVKGVKAGNAKVYAKVGKKKYTCQVKVINKKKLQPQLTGSLSKTCGTYTGAVWVKVNCPVADVKVYCTRDGSLPTTASDPYPYASGMYIYKDTTVRVLIAKAGYKSCYLTGNYQIKTPTVTPTVKPPSISMPSPKDEYSYPAAGSGYVTKAGYATVNLDGVWYRDVPAQFSTSYNYDVFKASPFNGGKGFQFTNYANCSAGQTFGDNDLQPVYVHNGVSDYATWVTLCQIPIYNANGTVAYSSLRSNTIMGENYIYARTIRCSDIDAKGYMTIYFDVSYATKVKDYPLTLDHNISGLMAVRYREQSTTVCGVCYGSGRCQICNGTGKAYGVTCQGCNGTGKCKYCNGTGRK